MFRDDLPGILNWITDHEYRKTKEYISMDYTGAFLAVGHFHSQLGWRDDTKQFMNPREAMTYFMSLLPKITI